MSLIPKDDIWPFRPGVFKVFVADPRKSKKIAGWKGCRKHATYVFPDGQVVIDVLVPARLYRRAREVMGLPALRKSPGRVAAGRRSGKAAAARGVLKKGTDRQKTIDFPMVGT
ncbi:MAG: hypothetical protein KAW17_12510 [Candidatus Eisenbacteria sp.]|nr:hypothetical protein [Candidatus Eisenbacteria bacterium]